MKWTADEVEAELERLQVPPIVSPSGLARATGVDARTLVNKCRAGQLGKVVKGPRNGLYVTRRSTAHYFSGAGEPIWTAAYSRRVPKATTSALSRESSEGEEWRTPNARHFTAEQRPHVRLLEVSNWGRVRTAVERRASPSGSILKPREGSGGYQYIYVTLPPSGRERLRAAKECRRPDYRGKNIAVHRLVASAWCDRKRGATEVHHGDGNRANNRAANLSWTSRRENAEIARQRGAVGRSWGRPTTKLWPEDVGDILTRQLGAQQYAEKYGVSERQIYKIWAGKQWKRFRPVG